jgi:hypothetical protein
MKRTEYNRKEGNVEKTGWCADVIKGDTKLKLHVGSIVLQAEVFALIKFRQNCSKVKFADIFFNY